MQDDLFPEAKALSPKLQWLKLHAVETQHMGRWAGQECPESGDDIPVWVCRLIEPKNGRENWSDAEIAGGNTEEEAILAFCIASGIPHWTVERHVAQRAD